MSKVRSSWLQDAAGAELDTRQAQVILATSQPIADDPRIQVVLPLAHPYERQGSLTNLEGRVQRISPEAPVPVVHVESETLRLGGAANVFNNVLALGGKADLCGVIGADESGRLLMKELGNKRSGRGGVVIDHDRPTTRKSRVIAHNQQIVRYDVEGRTELKAPMQRVGI